MDARLRIDPVRVRGYTDQMVATIMRLIEQGVLNQGDTLPPERELAQRFNVGRNTLREAIKVLEIYGVVERRTKTGTVIRSTNMDHILATAFAGLPVNLELFDEIQAFRLILESGIAPTVMERVDQSAIAALEHAIAMMGNTTDIDEQAQWDFNFHATLIELAGNKIVSRTFRVLGEAIRSLMRLGKGMSGMELSLAEHRTLLEAVRQRDTSHYIAVLKEHLRTGRQFLER
jgi:DNA-binding FadR family transcriptional regulator